MPTHLALFAPATVSVELAAEVGAWLEAASTASLDQFPNCDFLSVIFHFPINSAEKLTFVLNT